MEDGFERFRVQHLILLVGTNPLPNWVAACLLFDPKLGGKIWLLHSEELENSNTREIAERLQKLLLRKLFLGLNPEIMQAEELPVQLCGISSSGAGNIEDRLDRYRDYWNHAESIGLNYTGGSKPMAVHAYRWLEKQDFPLARDGQPKKLWFSYLDPRSLTLNIDRPLNAGTACFEVIKNKERREATTLSLEELAALHGYVPPENLDTEAWNTGDKNPAIYHLARAIGSAFADPGNVPRDQWRQWLDTCPTIPPDRGKYDALGEVIGAMDHLAGGAAQPPEIKAQAIADQLLVKKGTFTGCHLWFIGQWLEEYARAALIEAGRLTNWVSSTGRDLHYVAKIAGGDSDKFQLDAAAMVGYRLFAISCTTAGGYSLDLQKLQINLPETWKKLVKKEVSKEHLLEAYVRARQLGGDEACVGLICMVDDAAKLERELRRGWDPEGKILVFPRNTIADLPHAFARWMEGKRVS